jgi:hypothetical protein
MIDNAQLEKRRNTSPLSPEVLAACARHLITIAHGIRRTTHADIQSCATPRNLVTRWESGLVEISDLRSISRDRYAIVIASSQKR